VAVGPADPAVGDLPVRRLRQVDAVPAERRRRVRARVRAGHAAPRAVLVVVLAAAGAAAGPEVGAEPVAAGALHHVVHVAVEVGVHDPRAGVLALQARHLGLQQRVVLRRQRVEALQAAVLVVVAGAGGLVQRQVDREAPHGQHARDHHVHGAQADELLHALADGVHDGGALPARLLRGVAAEDLRVVVVAAELAQHEQGLGQVRLAGCANRVMLINGHLIDRSSSSMVHGPCVRCACMGSKFNGATYVRTLRRAADGRHQLLEPLDLGVEGPVVPDLVGDAQRLEEARVHGGRANDRHVGALLEV
jgi:hypothetical protein